MQAKDGAERLERTLQAAQDPDRFLEFCRYLRSLDPPATRIAIICDNFSPHLTTTTDADAEGRVLAWASASNVEITYTSEHIMANRIEAQLTALRYLALDGSDQASHKDHARMIRRYIIAGRREGFGPGP